MNIWTVQISCVMLRCVDLCCRVVWCDMCIIVTEAGLEAILTTHICNTMFHEPKASAAVLTVYARLIMLHEPCAVRVSFTSAAFETTVVVANVGNIVFHGPREDVVEFFESCGFCCPERKGVPDFLQEVTSKNDQKVSLLMYSPKLLVYVYFIARHIV